MSRKRVLVIAILTEYQYNEAEKQRKRRITHEHKSR